MPPPGPFYAAPMFWLYFLPWLLFTLCLIFYGFPRRRASGIRRAMLTLYASLVAILSLVLLILLGIVPDNAVRDWLRTFTLGGVTIAAAVQLATILRLRRTPRRDPDRSSS